jgi:hypothetical protein
MKRLILAALVASAAAGSAIAPAGAASLTITTGDSGHSDDYWRYNGRRHRDRDDNGWHRGWRQGMHLGWRERRAMRDCDYTEVRKWRNGRLIIERTRDCD